MKQIFAESYLLLALAHLELAFGGMRAVENRLRQELLRAGRKGETWSVGELCHAMDLCCVFYPKRVYCLHRAVATTRLLRRHGIPAEMVIGAQIMPFKSHAWVEVDHTVVNDRPYMRQIYRVL